jgi:hypothetical protein
MHKLLVLIAMFCCLTGYAQQITIKAESNNPSPDVGDNFQISYVIESPSNLGNAKLVPKAVNGLRFLNDGRSTGYYSNWVNGKSSVKYQLTYTVAYQAEKAGEYNIAPLEIVIEGKTYKSNSVKIVVSAVDQSKIVRSEEYYLDIAANKKSVYLGEPLSLTIKYYSQFNLSGLQINNEPEYNGFYKKDIASNGQSAVKTINGKQHVVGLYRQSLLIPIEAGTHHIPKLSGTISLVSQGFGFFQQTEERKIYSNTLSITVKPLPLSGQPASFSGAVGNFSISAKLDKDHVKANDAISYKVTIKGSGNIKMTELPKIAFPADFEVYDPKISENISTDASGMSGQKTYEYILIPKHAGESKIAALEFSYFNPATAQYQKTSAPEIAIRVDKGDGSAAGYVNKEDLKFAQKDIHYFAVNPDLLRQGKTPPFIGSTFFWLLALLPQLAMIAIVVLKRKKTYDAAEVIGSKNKNAAKVASKKLKVAEQHLQNKDNKAFYGAVLEALNSYLSDKFNIPLVNLNKQMIAEVLQTKGSSEQDIKECIALLEKCEMAQYAPVNDVISDIYAKALAIITKIEA